MLKSPRGNLGEQRDKDASGFFRKKIKDAGKIMRGLPYREHPRERDTPRMSIREA